MRLDEMRSLLIMIKLAGYSDKPVTRHAIARNCTSWSRSTTYRKLNKLVEVGLICIGEHLRPGELYITSDGQNFLKEFVKLKGIEDNG